jgi:hypothetical protein
MQARQRNPECLPEQLLCSAEGYGRSIHWRVRTAAQGRGVEPDAGEHQLRGRDMTRLAAVRRTGERQFVFGESVAIGGAALDQPQCLQCLDRRAWKHRAIDIATRECSSAIGIHRDRAAMAAFDHGAAQNLNQNRIVHDSP